METLEQTKTTQKIDLINGSFTASEASDIINSVLKVKINFHKFQRLSITEGNDKDECTYDNGRIVEPKANPLPICNIFFMCIFLLFVFGLKLFVSHHFLG